MEGGKKMSQPNEPPLALDSWTIIGKLNDGTDITIEPDDLRKGLRDEIDEVLAECVEFRIDHLKGKYAGEVPEAEDLHAQNSKRFVDYEKKSD